MEDKTRGRDDDKDEGHNVVDCYLSDKHVAHDSGCSLYTLYSAYFAGDSYKCNRFSRSVIHINRG